MSGRFFGLFGKSDTPVESVDTPDADTSSAPTPTPQPQPPPASPPLRKMASVETSPHDDGGDHDDAFVDVQSTSKESKLAALQAARTTRRLARLAASVSERRQKRPPPHRAVSLRARLAASLVTDDALKELGVRMRLLRALHRIEQDASKQPLAARYSLRSSSAEMRAELARHRQLSLPTPKALAVAVATAFGKQQQQQYHHHKAPAMPTATPTPSPFASAPVTPCASPRGASASADHNNNNNNHHNDDTPQMIPASSSLFAEMYGSDDHCVLPCQILLTPLGGTASAASAASGGIGLASAADVTPGVVQLTPVTLGAVAAAAAARGSHRIGSDAWTPSIASLELVVTLPPLGGRTRWRRTVLRDLLASVTLTEHDGSIVETLSGAANYALALAWNRAPQTLQSDLMLYEAAQSTVERSAMSNEEHVVVLPLMLSPSRDPDNGLLTLTTAARRARRLCVQLSRPSDLVEGLFDAEPGVTCVLAASVVMNTLPPLEPPPPPVRRPLYMLRTAPMQNITTTIGDGGVGTLAVPLDGVSPNDSIVGAFVSVTRHATASATSRYGAPSLPESDLLQMRLLLKPTSPLTSPTLVATAPLLTFGAHDLLVSNWWRAGLTVPLLGPPQASHTSRPRLLYAAVSPQALRRTSAPSPGWLRAALGEHLYIGLSYRTASSAQRTWTGTMASAAATAATTSVSQSWSASVTLIVETVDTVSMGE